MSFEMKEVAAKGLMIGIVLLFACFVIAFYQLGYTSASSIISKESALYTECLSIVLLGLGILAGTLIGKYVEEEAVKKKPEKTQPGTTQFF